MRDSLSKKRRMLLVQVVWKGYSGEQGHHPKFQNHPFRRSKYGAGKHFTCCDTFVSSNVAQFHWNVEPRDLTPVKNVHFGVASCLPRVVLYILSEW